VHAVSAERLSALVAAAATACADLGHPVTDPLDALANLPEVAPSEPCPVVRIPDSADGWLAVWEVTPDGSRRSAVAVFQPDRGFVRPDVAIAAWEQIVQDGVDHAYQAAARISGEAGFTLPGARLRLVVRITT